MARHEFGRIGQDPVVGIHASDGASLRVEHAVGAAAQPGALRADDAQCQEHHRPISTIISGGGRPAAAENSLTSLSIEVAMSSPLQNAALAASEASRLPPSNQTSPAAA